MRESEIIKRLEEQKSEGYRFVKWWRKEQDFLDFDLIERFERNASGYAEMAGFELLTLDDMWQELKRIGGNRVKLLHDASGDRIEWVHRGKSGERVQVCDYSPDSLMTIFDIETKGNPVDY